MVLVVVLIVSEAVFVGGIVLITHILVHFLRGISILRLFFVAKTLDLKVLLEDSKILVFVSGLSIVNRLLNPFLVVLPVSHSLASRLLHEVH